MAEWIGVINVTANKYFKGAADQTVRKRLLLRKLEKEGRITFNNSGTQCTWDVEFAEQAVEPYGDMGSISFSRSDLYRQLTHDWRGYIATDAMSEKERLMNAGMVAIIKRYDTILPKLRKSISNHFAGELFIDGNASGNENSLHGLETFLGVGSVTAADRLQPPSDTYAGKSTVVQNEGGTWSDTLSTQPSSTISTDWPDGNGDAEYDYISPKLINFQTTGWGTGSTTWEANCERCLRQATLWLTQTGGEDARPTMYLLAADLFYAYQNKMESKLRILVPHKEADDLGFPDTLNQEGVMIKSDFDVPAGIGYGINVNEMELASLDSSLFSTRGPIYDIKTDAYLFKAGFFGNARYNPKFFAKFKAYS